MKSKTFAVLALVAVAGLMAIGAIHGPEAVSAAAVGNGSFAVDPLALVYAVGAAGMMDVFKGDGFSLMSMTDRVNKMPFVPGRCGMLIPWGERGVNTTVIAIEENNGTLKLVPPTPRGAPGTTQAVGKRKMRNLTVPHFQLDDAIMAESVQGIREFGQESQLQTVKGVVDGRVFQLAGSLDATLEYQRVGAVKGVITYADGTTLNLFTEFGVSQETEVDFDLDNATPAKGALRKVCAGVSRLVADNMELQPYVGLHAICGNAFFDDLLAHAEVINSYLNTDMASVLRAGYVYPNGLKVYGAFEFGGIVWENYRGSVGGQAFVHTDKCHIFPMGSAGLFSTVFAPADYTETVNTVGLPRYAKQIEMRNGKGVDIEVQTNPLSYCTRPKALILGKRT